MSEPPGTSAQLVFFLVATQKPEGDPHQSRMRPTPTAHARINFGRMDSLRIDMLLFVKD